MKKKDSHTIGFAEDFIWNFLDNYDNDHFEGKRKVSFGLILNMFQIFIEMIFGQKALIYEIYTRSNLTKYHFVKHSFS